MKILKVAFFLLFFIFINFILDLIAYYFSSNAADHVINLSRERS